MIGTSKLDNLCREINKKADANIVQYGIKTYDVEYIPLSSPRANYCTYGGLPVGRLIEFFGDNGSGKTTTALDACKNAQILFESLDADNPKKVLYIDAENTLDARWATKLGVDCDKMVIMKPEQQTAEDIFQFVLDAIETGEVGLVVIDSLGVLLSAQAFEKDIADRTYGGISMPLTRFSEKAVQYCKKYDCTVIGINQMRDNLNSMYGGKTTTGGRGWQHNCSLRVEFNRGEFFDEKGNKVNQSFENPAGNYVQMSIRKNKCAPNDRKTGQYSLRYYTGIDYMSDVVDLAIKLGYIVQAGAWYSVFVPDTEEAIRCQGRTKVIETLNNEPELFSAISAKISEYIANS